MQKKYKGILLYTKVYKENDLIIKFLSNTDEIISGIVYGGLSKKKKNILQVGFFLNFNVSKIFNKPATISAELSEPLISSIIDNKYKLNCLLSVISLINLSIIEGQTVKNIFITTEDFLKIMIIKKNWISLYCIFLFNLLKIIGYAIDTKDSCIFKYFDLEKSEFSLTKTKHTIEFPYDLLNNKLSSNSYKSINNFFIIFENIYNKNHLSDLNLQLPNHYHYFKKLIIKFFENK